MKHDSKKHILFLLVLVSHFSLKSQTASWSFFADSISTYSSPHSHDINSDGVLDIVIGGGKDGENSSSGVMAIDGETGLELWVAASRNEVFGSAVFQDVTSDGIKDVFITGREAQFYALDGSDGSLLWDFFPHGTNPADSGWFNFYNPQLIEDIDGDSFMDFIVTNGGDHSAPEWETDRPPGQIVVLSSATGEILANTVVPDSAETYCSPVVADIQNNGVQWVLFGTGGENLGGSFYACPLTSILSNNTSGAITLSTDSLKGYIAPASVCLNHDSGSKDIVFVSFGGKVEKVNGQDFSSSWTFSHPGTESSAEPVLGNFTGDLTPDVFLTLFKGIAPSFSDFYQVMLDGSTGELKFIDSIGQLNYSSGNAIDLNNDGRDEAIASVSYNVNGYFQHRIEQINFVSNTISPLTSLEAGVNLGSTPLFVDINNDQVIELVYAYKKDSLNPGATNGIYVKRVDLSVLSPNTGIAWGSYLGTNSDAEYNYAPVNCGSGSVIASINTSQPSCNSLSDGSITVIPAGTAPHVYNWSDGSLQPYINNVPQGNYWVRVTDGNGCYEQRDVLLSDPYEITFGAISPPTCFGDNDGNATMSSSGCPCMFSACTFLWENGQTTKPNDSLHSGYNWVIITHTDGCVVTDSVLIPDPPAVIIDYSVESVLCFGDTNGVISLEMDSIYAPQNILWFNGDTTSYLDSLTSGNYFVSATDTRGCMDTMSIDVLSPPPIALSTNYNPLLCYGASNGEVVVQVTGGTPAYSYFLNNVEYQDSIISNLEEGNYLVLVSDSNNCSEEVEILLESLDPIEISFDVIPASDSLSYDGVAIASVSGGLPPFSYQWEGSTPDESVAVYLSSGWHTLEVADANGCISVDSVFVGAMSSLNILEQKVVAFPNPTSGKVYFGEGAEDIVVFSKKGEVVLEKGKGDFIDLSLLSSGIYYISLKVSGKIQTFPISRTLD